MEGRVFIIELLEHAPNQGNGIAQVGAVVGEEQPGLLVNDGHLDGG